ncbi:ABC transporter permease [Colwellia psychrerythraea]|uniref:MacB-like periplasmic core domain containing protein n=1 Tax=Colwellia psychrerythraea TaxID=28229 RepID=A0A099L1X1_COLPS|nr:FtsX-like permease family protein [Colwellia psychrerythraea]KGJ96445.1 MacB-like periplasmic core domain containing protein [Colwellia psychrerythraea]
MVQLINRSLAKVKQAMGLATINLKSFPHRAIASSVSILSIACVAAVILSVLAMTQGMVKTLEKTGLDDTLIVMRAGAISELQSVMFPAEVNILANHAQVLKNNDNQAMVSAEMFVNAQMLYLDKAGETHIEKLALRGISKGTYRFRPHFKMAAGVKFKTGIRQVIIGQAIARKIPELTVGSTITLGGAQWFVSGIFSDNNSVFESELWADIGMIQSDYQRGNTIQSVRLALKKNTDITALNKEWQDDPRLNLRIMYEKQFFASQAEDLTRLIRWVGFPVAFIMALGAMVAALNTMYATIASRSKEIATHKAIGFSGVAICFSILFEALLIALVGGLLGILPLYFIFDGWTASTQDANNLSQMLFNFELTVGLMMQTLLFSISIGLLGGILPAIKAMSLPVTVALRDN